MLVIHCLGQAGILDLGGLATGFRTRCTAAPQHVCGAAMALEVQSGAEHRVLFLV